MKDTEFQNRLGRGLTQADLTEAAADVQTAEGKIAESQRALDERLTSVSNLQRRMMDVSKRRRLLTDEISTASGLAVEATIKGSADAAKLRDAADGMRAEERWTKEAVDRLGDRDLPAAQRAVLVAKIDLGKAKANRAFAEAVRRKIATVLPMQEVWRNDPGASFTLPGADAMFREAMFIEDHEVKPHRRALEAFDRQAAA